MIITMRNGAKLLSKRVLINMHIRMTTRTGKMGNIINFIRANGPSKKEELMMVMAMICPKFPKMAKKEQVIERTRSLDNNKSDLVVRDDI